MIVKMCDEWSVKTFKCLIFIQVILEANTQKRTKMF